MIQVKFRNMKLSELIQDSVLQRLNSLIEKFPYLNKSKFLVSLSMENSPHQAGPDLFKVKVHIQGGVYDGVIIEKANSNLYVALAEVMDHMLEKLNRLGDKLRVKNRTRARKINDQVYRKIS